MSNVFPGAALESPLLRAELCVLVSVPLEPQAFCCSRSR